MFEVGFSELLLIMVLALVVLGPEKLPKVVSQVGRWMGRARAMARQFREQLEDEATLEPSSRRPTTRSATAWSPSADTPSAATPAAATAAAAADAPAAAAPPSPAEPPPAADAAAAWTTDPAPPGGYVNVADAPRAADEPRGT